MLLRRCMRTSKQKAIARSTNLVEQRCFCAPRDLKILDRDPLHCSRLGGKTFLTDDGLKRKYLIVGKTPILRESKRKLSFRGCLCGQIRRAFYITKGRLVKSHCITAQGLTPVLGLAKKIGVAAYKFKNPHLLRNQGYSQNASEKERHAAILRALKVHPDRLALLRHMQLIIIRSRNRPTNRSGLINMAHDIAWLGKRSGYQGYAQGRLAKSIRSATV